MSVNRDGLLKEYAQTLSSRLLLPIRLAGFLRFEIKNDTVVKKSLSYLWINLTMAFVYNISTFFIYYDLSQIHNFLLATEAIVLFTLNAVQNLNFINIFTFNRNSGIKMLNNCIDIDILLGSKETKFMRVISGRVLISTIILILFFKSFSVFGIMISSPPYLGIIIYCNIFIIFLFVFYDFCFFFNFWTFLTLRVRYLNVALIKYANLKPEIFPKDFILHTILWRDKFNDLVSFHKRSGQIEFKKAFLMILYQQGEVKKSFRFLMITGASSVLISTFVMVQSIINLIKSSDVDPLRIFGVTSWVFLGWAFMVGVAIMTGTFYEQIKLTKLICTYVKLNIDVPEETFGVMDAVFNVIKYRDAQYSIYGMYNMNMAIVTKIVLSMTLYIIFQLQLAFPGSSNTKTYNATNLTKENM